MNRHKTPSVVLPALWLMVILCVGFVANGQTAKDYLFLNNGDVVSGTIQELNDSVVVINTAALGQITVKKSDIKTITFSAVVPPRHASTYEKLGRPNYALPTWYKSIGVSVNALGTNVEVGRHLNATRLNVFAKTGWQILPNYSITTLPIELGFGLFHDTTKKWDFAQVHGGYAFLLSHNTWNTWYEPSFVYGFDYRHLFVNRNHSNQGTYLEVGYEGGVLKRELDNWWFPSATERVVHRNRFRVGFGYMF